MWVPALYASSAASSIMAAVVATGCLLLLARRVAHTARHEHKRMVYGPSKLNAFIARGLERSLARYTPTWWTNGHLQIILTFLVPQARLQYDRELLTLEDGGRAALDWAQESTRFSRTPLTATSPIVVVLHGLTGCSQAMRSLCAEALAHGYRPVVFNKRGHGGVPLATPSLQPFGCVRDLTLAIAHIERAFPQASALYGIGFSAGSGLLCSYFGETGTSSRLDAGVLISPGYSALELFTANRIHPLYDFLMTFSLKSFLKRHAHALADVIHIPSAMQAKSIREFDEHVFMKMHGYEDLTSYWADNNPMRAINNLMRPMLCINALDDPVCTKEMIPYEEFEQGPLRFLVETGSGSHCAFFEGHVRLKSWADGLAMEYLSLVREYQQQQKQQPTEEKQEKLEKVKEVTAVAK